VTEDHKMNQKYFCSKLGELGKSEINNENRSNSTFVGVLGRYELCGNQTNIKHQLLLYNKMRITQSQQPVLHLYLYIYLYAISSTHTHYKYNLF